MKSKCQYKTVSISSIRGYFERKPKNILTDMNKNQTGYVTQITYYIICLITFEWLYDDLPLDRESFRLTGRR